jgi:iron complex transport system ATP-binding protein
VTTSAPAALRVRELAIGYRARGERRALLEHVNLAVEAGELVCLLGPNGIGKSTLLRTLGRMQPPLWGTIEIGGRDIGSMTQTTLARRLGVVLTERVAVEAFSVRRVIELGRYPHCGWLGRLDANDRRVVDWAIDAVGVRHLADRDFSCLSDGERQRVMIARALAQQPMVLLLDELMALLRQLTREAALAVVISSHDLELALRTADRVWLVMPGGGLMTGAPEDIVLAGGIAEAFEGRQIRFHPEERTFRLLGGQRGSALVRGSGVRAALARAVLEREGYAVDGTDRDAPALCVESGEWGWRVATPEGALHGAEDFASLATFLRGRENGR